MLDPNTVNNDTELVKIRYIQKGTYGRVYQVSDNGNNHLALKRNIKDVGYRLHCRT